ncbi:hypothetical protein I4U23_010446 [Adineta vaga]|nr:hypothetical protein I4U23_010446 [Adineta vaga]
MVKSSRTKKSTKEIGDMGFGGEELLLGGRLFPVIDVPKEYKFKIVDLRIDIHKQSSIPVKKATLDLNFIKHFFDLNQLQNIENFNHFKVQFDQLFDINEATEGAPFHVTPIRVKRQKLKHADSDSSPSSSSSTSESSIYMNNLSNVDPNDPNVLYPSFYIPPPDFVPRSPHSTEDEDSDTEPYCVNGMPPNFRE